MDSKYMDLSIFFRDKLENLFKQILFRKKTIFFSNDFRTSLFQNYLRNCPTKCPSKEFSRKENQQTTKDVRISTRDRYPFYCNLPFYYTSVSKDQFEASIDGNMILPKWIDMINTLYIRIIL